MRIKGTNYKTINELPSDAVPVSEYATSKGVKVGTIYMRYIRFKDGYVTSGGNQSKGSDPGYQIRCYKGINFVVLNN